jgi:hypothetical protein
MPERWHPVLPALCDHRAGCLTLAPRRVLPPSAWETGWENGRAASLWTAAGLFVRFHLSV